MEEFNSFLKETSSGIRTPLFVFITGASGAGKSYVAQVLERELDPQFVRVEFFDRIGVPPVEEMIKEYGSCEKWQERMTYEWVKRLASEKDKKVVILEGQFNPQFVVEACKEYKVSHYILIALHANQAVREQRLRVERSQPELITETMNTWADFLRQKTQDLDGVVIDTSNSDSAAIVGKIITAIEEKLQTLK